MCISCKECKKSKGCGCSVPMIMKVLIIVGGINWGSIGAGMLSGSSANMNLVNIFFGTVPTLEAFVYLLVGIAAVVSIFGYKCKTCKKGTCCSTCDNGRKE